MVVAEHGRALSRRFLVRLTVIAVSLSMALAVIMALFQRQAEAQNPFFQIVCPILFNLRNSFGGFLTGILNALLIAFGCGISG